MVLRGQVVGPLVVLAGLGAAMQAADDHHPPVERATPFTTRAAHAPTKGGGHSQALWFQWVQHVPAHGEQDGLRSMQVRVLLKHRPGLRGDLVNGL
jgi:hypothetical protein